MQMKAIKSTIAALSNNTVLGLDKLAYFKLRFVFGKINLHLR